MTVSYSLKVANGGSLAFFKLLLCWKGSIYKCIWLEVVLYFAMYFVISVIYRYGLNQDQRNTFEALVHYCESFTAYIPITFMLGFYVSLIVGRWWEAFWKLPWPDSMCAMGLLGLGVLPTNCAYITYISIFSAVCSGTDEYSSNMRKTYLRYLICAQVLALRTISIPVRKRFPTMNHVKEAGLLTEGEMTLLESKGLEQNSWAAVCFWNMSLINELRDKPRGNPKRTLSDIIYIKLLDEIAEYKSTIGSLTCYDWISVPLQYTQVVTIAVYSFFTACLIGRQYITPELGPPPTIDLYFPFFTFFQFCFYVGWLKVAEKLMNPFGEDDDDFETNWLIDRNLRLGSMLADDLMGKPPMKVGDLFDDETPQLPYTEGSVGVGDNPMVGSAMAVVVPTEDARVIPIAGSVAPSQRSASSRGSSVRKTAARKMSTFLRQLTRGPDASRQDAVSPTEPPLDAEQIVLEHIAEIDDIAFHTNNGVVKGASPPLFLHTQRHPSQPQGTSHAGNLTPISEESPVKPFFAGTPPAGILSGVNGQPVNGAAVSEQIEMRQPHSPNKVTTENQN